MHQIYQNDATWIEMIEMWGNVHKVKTSVKDTHIHTVPTSIKLHPQKSAKARLLSFCILAQPWAQRLIKGPMLRSTNWVITWSQILASNSPSKSLLVVKKLSLTLVHLYLAWLWCLKCVVCQGKVKKHQDSRHKCNNHKSKSNNSAMCKALGPLTVRRSWVKLGAGTVSGQASIV